MRAFSHSGMATGRAAPGGGVVDLEILDGKVRHVALPEAAGRKPGGATWP